MGLQKLGLLCIDFLSWPMLALAYPLCASIRAIETGSKYHMRKLVTYWTVLSILSLFEHTLRVMEWVPRWPYIKLVGTFWLVIPEFNGACYAYDCLVNADLGAKLHCILSQFTRALYAQNQLSKDFEAMEQTTEQGTEETKVKRVADNLGEMRKQETEAPWVKGIPVAISAEEKFIPEINSSMLIQREWTCALCQVTTTSENNLKSHLQGKRHRTNCEKQESSKRVTKRPEIFLSKSNRAPKSRK